MKGKWTLVLGATDEETAVMETWPEKWWEDMVWCKAELVKYPKCVLVDEFGETCNDIDPDGPGSCHCPRCNLVVALTEEHNNSERARK